MIKKILIICIILFAGSFELFAQPNLVLSKNEVEYEDNFDRLQNIFLINTGDQTVVIDTMTYNADLYTVRFDKQDGFPLNISPGDTVKMDLLLSGYYLVTSADTTDTLIISGNLESQTVKTNKIIEVKIDVYDDDHPDGIIKGVVKENGTPLRDAFVLFFYDGIYNIKEVKTDNLGKYSAFLPRGEYIVAAAKDSFYVSFYDQKFDPLEANKVELESDSAKTINFGLTRMDSTGNSVGGYVIDANTNSKVRSGIVIVRRGRHTPSKISYSIKADSLPNEVYSSFVRPDGTFFVDNILQQDYYFVQSFSNYFLPSYYSSSQGGNIFWQQSDSVLVNGPIQNINISMPRDSAFGKGSVSGKIILPANSTTSFSNIMVYAKSPLDNFAYNYSYVDSLGNYKIVNLPQGDYKMIAQNIGSDDAESQVVTIDTTNVFATGINISFGVVTSVGNNNIIPNNFKLFQNYPNPFNPSTIIRYSIPNNASTNNAKAVLIIYDLLGRKVAVLVNEVKSAGTYEVKFNARNLASGVYFYRLIVGSFSTVKKLMLLK